MKLISFICQNDSDLLPHFFRWYRGLGVTSFYFVLHGDWSHERLKTLESCEGVILAKQIHEPFSETLKMAEVTRVARQFVGEWVVFADTDEFLELPTTSLNEMIGVLDSAGISQLCATLLQRISQDGSLPEIKEDSNLDQLFPLFSYGLCEEMGLSSPIWKSKYPLARINSKFTYSRGHHLPQTPVAHLPIRAVVHHFKWRDRLLKSFSQNRGSGTNFQEMDFYRSYISQFETLPIETAKRLSRETLSAEGWLRTPTPQEWPIIKEMAQEKQIVSKNPIRIAFVTFEFSGPNTTNGGIATAMSALAKLLAAHSYQVEIFYCPFTEGQFLSNLWYETWGAQGIKLHFIPRTTGFPDTRCLSSREFNASLLQRIEEAGYFDILHFHDTQGYATPFALLKKAQLKFTDTQIAITTHGGTRWHNENNGSPWSQYAYFNELVGQRLCDILVSPSQYMIEYNKNLDAAGSKQVHLFNVLDPESKSFKAATQAPLYPKSLAFFGRIERRKGIEFFIATLKQLASNAKIKPEIFFCGRFGNGYSDDDLQAALQGLDFKFHFFHSLNPEQALGLIKEKESLVILPSKLENSPYVVWEVIENQIPFLANFTGGTPELINPEDQSRVTLPNTPSAAAIEIENIFEQGMVPVRPRIWALENELKHLKFWRQLKENKELADPLPKRPLPVFRASDFRKVSPSANEPIVALIPQGSEIDEAHLEHLANILHSYPQANLVYPAFELTLKKKNLTLDTSILDYLEHKDISALIKEVPLVVRASFLKEVQSLNSQSKKDLTTGAILEEGMKNEDSCLNLPFPIYKQDVVFDTEQIIPLIKMKLLTPPGKPRRPETENTQLYMPCGVLSYAPLVTISSILPNAPFGALPVIPPALLEQPSLHLLQFDSLTSFYDQLAWQISEAKVRWPKAHFCLLAKNSLQLEQFFRLGIHAICADLSIFVDENIFKPSTLITNTPPFDAVYRMPLSASSNYQLASKIERLALIGYSYSNSTKEESEIRSHLPLAHFLNASEDSSTLSLPTELQTATWFNQCDTGLALRPSFDNRLAVVQQLLCGTPIVSTSSFHGCQMLLRPEFSIRVDDSPESVVRGVKELQGRMLSREEIHETVRKLLLEARKSFIDDINTMIRQYFGGSHQISDLSHLVGALTKYRNAKKVFSEPASDKVGFFHYLPGRKYLSKLFPIRH